LITHRTPPGPTTAALHEHHPVASVEDIVGFEHTGFGGAMLLHAAIRVDAASAFAAYLGHPPPVLDWLHPPPHLPQHHRRFPLSRRPLI